MALGILAYIIVTLYLKCMAKSAERKQIKSMNSFNTIEVAHSTARAGTDGNAPAPAHMHSE